MLTVPYMVACIFILAGVPLALRLVSQNRWYGVRTAYTLGDPQVWFRVNEAGGKALIVAGSLSVVGISVFDGLWSGSAANKEMLAMMIPLGLLVVVFGRALTVK